MKQIMENALVHLRNNGFTAVSFATGVEAADWLVAQIAEGEEVGFGGSMTLRQLDLAAKLQAKKVKLLDHWQPGLSSEEREILFRRVFSADAYFSSVNAMTEDGFLLNIDGTGNRVAATVFGPKRVFFVVGQNKLVKDVPAAFARAEQAAVANAQRLQRNTPCVETGKCMDCQSAERICRAYMLIKRPPTAVIATVVLIEETLG
ncbi:MAG: lactate utilization protein [Clostridiales bacterium]